MLSRWPAVLLLALAPIACGRGGESAQKPMPPAGAAPQQVTPAPDLFRVSFETSRGTFVLETHRDWSPRGVDRFYQLVKSGFYDNNRFFRVVPGFVVQWGAHGDPAVAASWEKLPIEDDSVTHSNKRGTITFATSGPNTRTTQLFINLVDNKQLDGMGFSAFGEVVEGMAVVDSLYSGYGDGPPSGFGPDQGEIATNGNSYLERAFPKLDFIRTARVMESVVPPGMPKPPTPVDTGKK
ncbi:MAG: peptidylprolyl isomerase [Gemmatimonadaceae bacterium]